MLNLNPSMRLKVNRDTIFLPDSNDSIYFRNNLSSFRLEGSTIDKWIEKLIPMFNGEYTLEDLTGGLSESYRNHVYEIAEVLYRNRFVRDVSQDHPHQLSDIVLKEYASQIEFLDSFGGSGAYRFQVYRQSKVLAVGSGPALISLVSSLLESGLSSFHVLITNSTPTDAKRLEELVANFQQTDQEVTVEKLITPQKAGMSFWREAVQPFDSILYVAQANDVEELRILNTVCRQEKKVLLPALLQHIGLVGPLVHPESEGCWESAWRSIHQYLFSKESKFNTCSFTVSAMLTNVMVFELFKKITGLTEFTQMNQFFLLNMDTLEGGWYSFMPHPLVTKCTVAKWIHNFDLRFKQSSDRGKTSKLLPYFSQLTSKESGVFHIWEEGGLTQLPLAQCCVQVADPLSQGPAELLPSIICTGLTHEEAKREAGLTGIEAYVSHMMVLLAETLPLHEEIENNVIGLKKFVGVGAGETVVEGICRGLQRCLNEELSKQRGNQKNLVTRIQLDEIKDERCQFYLQALTTMKGEPIVGLGEEINGFPVVWICTGDLWFSSVGLNITLALQQALQEALIKEQNLKDCLVSDINSEVQSVVLEEISMMNILIPKCEESVKLEVLQSAMQVLKQNRIRPLIFELLMKSLFKDELSGIYGMLLLEEDS
ncbi:putative thiazole-containing bacteriocin maturation protein [Bacillus wiedmannii]|uniref:putative thiazole-containing bacteriocin maturation protein n=1 Tax=Bacillus wiedmannii TaxID=1890302 RepID=UPI000BFA8DCD|nr:putative thiazole-containing bacteriocin maturation protein [Bacillus wiedmannii]PFX61597.1 putative thiazole-containing bacteriocin maturation protein [Bacillus wiedmannii]